MELTITPLSRSSNSQIVFHRRVVYFSCSSSFSPAASLALHMQTSFEGSCLRSSLWMHHYSRKLLVKLSSTTPVSSEELVARSDADEQDVIKMKICVAGEKTQQIFDKVFTRLVEAAQPIPGFRRVKGGKTPDIPKHILMHILGPSKVNSHVIREIISSAVAECIEKEGLKVTKDLRVDETLEELEAQFEPGKPLDFSASLTLQKNT